MLNFINKFRKINSIQKKKIINTISSLSKEKEEIGNRFFNMLRYDNSMKKIVCEKLVRRMLAGKHYANKLEKFSSELAMRDYVKENELNKIVFEFAEAVREDYFGVHEQIFYDVCINYIKSFAKKDINSIINELLYYLDEHRHDNNKFDIDKYNKFDIDKFENCKETILDKYYTKKLKAIEKSI